MSNDTQVVTIGRNVGNVPMTAEAWRSFKSEVRRTLSRYGTIIQDPLDGHQAGCWEGQVCEDAATFVVLCPSSHSQASRPALRGLAAKYRQEAIGLIVVTGDRHLIETTAEDREEYGSAALTRSPTYGEETADGFIVGV